MHKWIKRSALLAALACTSALARPTMTAEEAIKREYPNSKTEIVDTREVNGVKVEDVMITTAKGQQATAKVTEYGDFVLIGVPRGDESISQPAIDTLSGLFNAGQKDVDVYRVTSYLVDVSSGKKMFRLRFDPVGRLHDISNESEINRDDVKNFEKVNDKAKSLKADDYARKYTEGATVEGVYKAPDADDFYLVDMKEKNGMDARLTLNNAGRVFSFRDEIPSNDLPKPVVDAIAQMFGGAKIDRAYRYEYEYYQMDKVTPDGDQMNIQIRPNGDVLSVRNEGPAKSTATPRKKRG